MNQLRWILLVGLASGCGDSENLAPGDDDDITVATLNLLHGVFCPGETDSCRLPDRVDLLAAWIEDTCPDVVTLQEISTAAEALITGRLDALCPFSYQLRYQRLNSIDDTVILTRYPALDSGIVALLDNFRHVAYVRVDHPRGPVEVHTTHLASSSDGGTEPCGASCPATCTSSGATTIRQCQAVQTAEFAASRADDAIAVIITGDVNADATSVEYAAFTDRGWLDSFIHAGNAECAPETGVGCTSGRDDDRLAELESPQLNQTTRIDYAFVSPGTASDCRAEIEPAGDADGDRIATGGFADAPNPFAASCGPAPAPICWPSDHGGVLVDVNCR